MEVEQNGDKISDQIEEMNKEMSDVFGNDPEENFFGNLTENNEK